MDQCYRNRNEGLRKINKEVGIGDEDDKVNYLIRQPETKT